MEFLSESQLEKKKRIPVGFFAETEKLILKSIEEI